MEDKVEFPGIAKRFTGISSAKLFGKRFCQTIDDLCAVPGPINTLLLFHHDPIAKSIICQYFQQIDLADRKRPCVTNQFYRITTHHVYIECRRLNSLIRFR